MSGHPEGGRLDVRDCPVGSPWRAGGETPGRAAEPFRRRVPVKRLCWSTQRPPQSVTAADARRGLSHPGSGQHRPPLARPEPRAGREWAGCTPRGPQTTEGQLGSQTVVTGAPMATDGPRCRDGRGQPHGTTGSQGWGRRPKVHVGHTPPGSGADGEPRKCLPRRLEATVASRSRCRAWLPTGEEDVLACGQTHCPGAGCPGC